MSYLQYKTRAMSSPQGKPKVYFCCHKSDFDRYFKVISDEILNEINCSVWYCPNDTAEEITPLYEGLQEMSLFVVPVTANLLCTENSALNVQLKIAAGLHIPILPLMQEKGLESIFNQKFGELQYLDKFCKDGTAITYEEKFRKYLHSHLTDDNTAESIRNAFDGYMFLSYRKKDRKYAKELMNLIHKTDCCRDIAIWYDEFLTPGENFNDSIKLSLKNSDLFVLAVTPNIANETNYILTTEYPMAVEMNKEILPVEIVPSDRTLIMNNYPGLPQIISAYQGNELSDILIKKISALNIAKNDNSPHHLYLIGLAYLLGIDVEPNINMAISLITQSAQKGDTCAMQRLSDIYKSGQGVETDHDKAIFWAEKRIEALEYDYNMYPDENKLNDLFWEMINLGSYYQDTGNVEKSKNIRFEALKITNNSEFINTNYIIERNLAYAYLYLGQAFNMEGDFDTAKKLSDRAYEIYENVISYLDDDSISSDMMRFLHEAALNAHMNGDIDSEEKYYLESFDRYKKIASESNNTDDMRLIADCYINLANVYLSKKQLKKSDEYYLMAHDIYRFVAEEKRTPDSKSDLAASYAAISNIYMKNGDSQSAVECAMKSLDIYIQADEEEASSYSKEKLALGYGVVAGVYSGMNDVDNAKLYYRKAFEIVFDLIDTEESFFIHRYHYLLYVELGDLLYNNNGMKSGFECYAKAYKICSEMKEKYNHRDIEKDLGNIYIKIAKAFKDNDETEDAEQYYYMALDIYTGLLNGTPSPSDYEKTSEIYYSLATLYEDTNREYLENAIGIMKYLSEACPEVERYKKLYELMKNRM